MRREGRVSGNLWRPHLREKLVKVRGKPTNASKFSGKCNGARCPCCHAGLPVSKSMAKTKGRNKRALPLDDDWVLRRPLCGSNRISKTALLGIDYDICNNPDVRHAAQHGGSDYEVIPPFCDVSAALSVNLCISANSRHDAKAVYDDVAQSPRRSLEKDVDSVVTIPPDALVDHMCASNGVNPAKAEQHADTHSIEDVYDYKGFDAQAPDDLFSYDVCRLTRLADAAAHLSEMFEASDVAVTPYVGDVSKCCDHKKFVDMVDDVILDIGISVKSKDCVDDSNDSSCECLTDEAVSDSESEKSSIDDDWCHVMPVEMINDWYLC